MLKKTKKAVKNNKGYTLMELILVITVGAIIMLTSMLFYQKARDAAVADSTVKRIHAIMAGLSELRMYKGKLTSGERIIGSDLHIDI